MIDDVIFESLLEDYEENRVDALGFVRGILKNRSTLGEAHFVAALAIVEAELAWDGGA